MLLPIIVDSAPFISMECALAANDPGLPHSLQRHRQPVQFDKPLIRRRK
jgi:hypothetical protein